MTSASVSGGHRELIFILVQSSFLPDTAKECLLYLFSFRVVGISSFYNVSQGTKSMKGVSAYSPYRGLSSGGALARLTRGMCRVLLLGCSLGGRNGRGGSSGERRGELSPRARRSGERGARGQEERSASSPSSSSWIEGSFFTNPPLLSQSTWGR